MTRNDIYKTYNTFVEFLKWPPADSIEIIPMYRDNPEGIVLVTGRWNTKGLNLMFNSFEWQLSLDNGNVVRVNSRHDFSTISHHFEMALDREAAPLISDVS